MHFDYQTFGKWLRQARVSNLPVMSQDQVAEKIGATQAKVSRWELEKPNTDPPTLDQIVRLADLFDVDFIALARMCGRWSDELEERITVALEASKKGLTESAHNPRSVVSPIWAVRPTDNRPATRKAA